MWNAFILVSNAFGNAHAYCLMSGNQLLAGMALLHKAALPILSFFLVPTAPGSADNGKVLTDIALGIASDGAKPQFPFTNGDVKAILAAAPEFQSMHNIHARKLIGRWARALVPNSANLSKSDSSFMCAFIRASTKPEGQLINFRTKKGNTQGENPAAKTESTMWGRKGLNAGRK